MEKHAREKIWDSWKKEHLPIITKSPLTTLT